VSVTDVACPDDLHERTPIRALACLLVAAVGLTFVGHRLLGERLGADFLCYWTAGKLLGSGQNAYDPVLQTRMQHAIGWDKATMGYGVWDFLPMNHPIWFVPLTIPLQPLGYPAAKIVWVVIGFLALLVAGYLTRDRLPELRTWVAPAAMALFLPSMIAACQGQSTPLVVFLLALGARLLRDGRDRAAGLALAWLTIKPQLSALVVLGLMLWAIRQRRTGLIVGFSVMFGGILLASTVALPDWPLAWLAALRHSPLPTVDHPELGASWLTVLRTFGASGWMLWGLYALLAVPALSVVLLRAWDRANSADEVIAWGIVAAFLVSPYSRLYDYAVLILPLLAGGRVRVAVLLLLSSWALLALLGSINASPHFPGTGLKLYCFFYIPIAVALTTSFQPTRAEAGLPVRTTV
jgi:Glycosyltransferase family 87